MSNRARPRELSTDELLALMNARLLQVEQQGLKQPTIQATAQEQRVAAAVVNELLPRPTVDHLKSAPARSDSKLSSIGRASKTSEDGLKQGVREMERARRVVDSVVAKGQSQVADQEAIARPTIPSILDQHFVPASEKRELDRDVEDDEIMEGAQLIPGTELSRPAVPHVPKDLPENNPFRIVRESVSAKNLKLQQESKPAFPGLKFFDPEEGPVSKLAAMARSVGASVQDENNRTSREDVLQRERASSVGISSGEVRSQQVRREEPPQLASSKWDSHSSAKDEAAKTLHDRRALLARRAGELRARGQALPGSNAPPPKKPEPPVPKKFGPAEKLSSTLAAYRAQSSGTTKNSTSQHSTHGEIASPSSVSSSTSSIELPSMSDIRKLDFSLSMPGDFAPKSTSHTETRSAEGPISNPTSGIVSNSKNLLPRSPLTSDDPITPTKSQRQSNDGSENLPPGKPFSIAGRDCETSQNEIHPVSIENEVETQLPSMPKAKHAGPPKPTFKPKPKPPVVDDDEEEDGDEEGNAETAQMTAGRAVALAMFKRLKEVQSRAPQEPSNLNVASETSLPSATANLGIPETVSKPAPKSVAPVPALPSQVAPTIHSGRTGISFTVAEEPEKAPTHDDLRIAEANERAAEHAARQQLMARRKYFSDMTVRVLKDRCKRAKIPCQNMTKQQMVDALATHVGA